MTLDDYAKHLGGLLGNLQSFEFLLRRFLQNLPGARPLGVPSGTDIYSLGVGSILPESEITSYDSLGQLIGKYNAEMLNRGGSPLDTSLVSIRDALAHGRVSSAVVEGHLRLIKFDRPVNGLVRVTFNEIVDEQWLSANKKRVYEAMQSVLSNI